MTGAITDHIGQGFTLLKDFIGPYGSEESVCKAITAYKEAKKLFRLGIIVGEDINQQDSDGYSIAMYAALFGDTDMFDFCVSRNADISLKDREGFTLLEYLFLDGKVEFLEHIKDMHSTLVNKVFEQRVEELIGYLTSSHSDNGSDFSL